MKVEWSVIVCLYNSSIDDLIKTIDSVVIQKNTSYEIIVADDCSKVNLENQITDYVSKYNGLSFKYIYNEKNLGTVKNIMNALLHCNGEFIKTIGCGDMLYSSDSLSSIGLFMKNKKAEICFTKGKAYVETEEGIQISDFNTPLIIKPYKNNDLKKINQNLVLYGDQISGAVTFYKKDTLIKYLNVIKETIIYVEDFMPKFISCDNIPIHFYDIFGVYYQYGTGISTKKTKSNNQRLINDLVHMYELLYKYAPNNINVQKLKEINLLNSQGKIKRILTKLIKCPTLYIHFLKANYYQRKNFTNWTKITSFYKKENEYASN